MITILPDTNHYPVWINLLYDTFRLPSAKSPEDIQKQIRISECKKKRKHLLGKDQTEHTCD